MDARYVMDATTMSFGDVHNALRLFTTLQLTASLFPQQTAVKNGDSFDFIIVGAGSAGCLLANRLTEIESINVLLVEAGGDPPLESILPSMSSAFPHSHVDWNYTSEDDGYTSQAHKNRVLDLTRGKMLGGTSSLNYMFYVRGDPSNYNKWAAVTGDESWNWENVLPYFIKSERLNDEIVLNSSNTGFHGKSGYLEVTKDSNLEAIDYLNALKELGYNVTLDINGYNTLSFTQPMFTINNGVRQSSATAFLSPIKTRPNLHVLKNCFVTKVEIDEHKRATGVEIMLKNQNLVKIFAKKEVLLSAGAINTPQLLMLSGIGPKKHLRSLNIKVKANLPVGNNFQDHPYTILVHKGRKSIKPKFTASPLKIPFVGFTGFVSLSKQKGDPDYQVISNILPNDTPEYFEQCLEAYRFKNIICNSIYRAGFQRELLLTNIILSIPESRGDILLRSKNPFDPPVIRTGYFSVRKDLDNMVKYIEDFNKIFHSSFYKSIEAEFVNIDLPECDDFQFGTSDYWRCYLLETVSTMYHYCGTAAMGSVVDSRLKVNDVTHLRVVDASIIPIIPSGNINAAVMMIAEKASDMIKYDYGYKT